MGSQQDVYDAGLVSIEQGLRHMVARQSFTLLADSQTAMLYAHPGRRPGIRIGYCSSNHTSPRCYHIGTDVDCCIIKISECYVSDYPDDMSHLC